MRGDDFFFMVLFCVCISKQDFSVRPGLFWHSFYRQKWAQTHGNLSVYVSRMLGLSLCYSPTFQVGVVACSFQEPCFQSAVQLWLGFFF